MPKIRPSFWPIITGLIAFALWFGPTFALALKDCGTTMSAVNLGPPDCRISALYLHEGRPAATLVIAAHGGLASKETTLAFCWEAVARGADCLALDLPGHGASDRVFSPAKTDPDGCRRLFEGFARSVSQADFSGIDQRGNRRLVFVGHSLGASIGCGRIAPCRQCACVGSAGACRGTQAVVYGRIHHDLGLPARPGYLISHVLEPWDPRVVAQAMDRILGRSPGAQSRIFIRVLLTWLAFVGAAGLGIWFVRLLRKRCARWSQESVLKSVLLASMSALFLALLFALAAWRRLWWLWPTHGSDALVAGVVLVFALLFIGIASGLSRVLPGARLPERIVRWGAAVSGIAAGLLGAVVVPALWPAVCPLQLLHLIFPLMSITSLGVLLLQCLALDRRACPIERLLFCSILMAFFLALLMPNFSLA